MFAVFLMSKNFTIKGIPEINPNGIVPIGSKIDFDLTVAKS